MVIVGSSIIIRMRAIGRRTEIRQEIFQQGRIDARIVLFQQQVENNQAEEWRDEEDPATPSTAQASDGAQHRGRRRRSKTENMNSEEIRRDKNEKDKKEKEDGSMDPKCHRLREIRKNSHKYKHNHQQHLV
jgi:hypothetical protein